MTRGVMQAPGKSHKPLPVLQNTLQNALGGRICRGHAPVGVPDDDVAIEARGDQQPGVGVVLDVLDPAGVAVQGAHFGVELPQVPERDGGVVGAGGEQPVVQEPGNEGNAAQGRQEGRLPWAGNASQQR